ncbi:MAG: hypothetical protein ABMA64_11650 [Myxococcota bacterium]
MSAFDAWLESGSAVEADWSPHLARLGARGELGRAGRWLLDVPALSAPYGCDSAGCTPRLRQPGMRSCCADLAVGISPAEETAVAAALGRVARYLAPIDERWARGAPAWRDDDTLTRPGGRCVFAHRAPGLRCALHEVEDLDGLPRGALKPLPCRLFPLFVVDLGDGRRLLTAVHRRTAAIAETYPARRFPCLVDAARPPLWESCRDTLVELFGSRTYRAIDAEMRRHATAAPAAGHDAP